MCYKLESSFVLIHALRVRESYTIADIVAIKRKVEERISSVYLDVSRNSILETISSYPEIFSWENEHIKRKSSAFCYFEDDDAMAFFNNTDMSERLELQIIQCIESHG